MDESTETLAKSQLETLYRLGILDRSSDEEEREQNSENEKSRVTKRHDAFLAALPPPAVFPLPSRILQSSIDDSDSSQLSSSNRNSVFYESSEVSSRLLELSRRRQRYKPRRNTSLHSSSSMKSSSSQLRRNRRELRNSFRQWEGFIKYRREKARRLGAAEKFVKQSVFTKWASFLKQRRYEHEKISLIDSWKLFRAILRWAEWKKRRCVLRRLLDGCRSSFMGRLMQQRVWRRWIQFTKRRKYVHDVLVQRRFYLRHRLVRYAWIELRIYAFRARQDYLLLRRCLTTMGNLLIIHEQQHLMCVQHLKKVNFGRQRKVLQRWRVLTDASSRDRKLAWHVQFIIRRKRYFLLWREVARSFNHVEHLRSKIMFRELYQHFSVWKTTTKAIQIGDRVRKNYEKRIRVTYFRALNDQAMFGVHCSHVKLELNHRRLAVAVNRLRVWATERRHRRDGIHRIQQMWQTRLLRQVWVTGWLEIHRSIKADKHFWAALRIRYFGNWKIFIRSRQAYHLQEEKTEALHGKFCCKRALSGLKNYYRLRLKHAQELVRAQDHYRVHLLQRGVIILWGAVYQNAQNSLRSHQLRQNMRTFLKKRYFHAWRSWVLSRKRLTEQFHSLQHILGYQNSFWNPRRRTWNRWKMFVSLRRQRLCGDRYFRLFLKRKVLFEWHRQAKLESSLRVFQFHRCKREFRNQFGRWKSRVEKWKKVGVICELAQQVYERKLCTRVIRDWRHCSTYFRRIRLCGESVRQQHEMKLQTMWFLKWQETFVLHQCVSKLWRRRERQLLRTFLTSWFRYSIQQKAFTRKLTHFHQVYGKYPASSIMSRAWCHWQRTCNQTRRIKPLHRKTQLRLVCRCWLHWKFFHAACYIFRAWRQVAHTMSSSSNRLGMRLRCFRESRRHRVQRCTMDEWKWLVERMRNLQERQSLWKHRLNRELEKSKWRFEQATRHYLSSWFRRWCVAQKNDSNVARIHFRSSVLSKVILSWWKSTIHSKQEKVLVEAQQAMGKLSYYHPQQHVLAQARRTDSQKKKIKFPKRKVKIAVTDVAIDRMESMRKMRRMLDPIEDASYSRFYQENGRNTSPRKPYDGKTKTLHAKNIVDHPVSDLEPPRRLYSDKSHQVGQPRRVGIENCDHSISGGGGMEQKQTCNSDCDTARQPKQQQHLVAPVTSSQVSFEPQAQEHLHIAHAPVLPEVGNTPHQQYTKAVENVLPLFDDQLTSGSTGIIHKTERVAIAEKRVRFAPDLRCEQTTNTFGQSSDHQSDSFITGANTFEPTHLNHTNGPRTLHIDSREHDEIRTTRSVPPKTFDSSLNLAPTSDSNRADRLHKPQMTRRRKPVHKKQLKVVISSHNETRPLSDILKLIDGVDTNTSKCSEALDASEWNNNIVWDTSVLKEITSFYVDSVMTHKSDKGLTTRIHVCFRMARDLALLQNDFYIDELHKVYEATFIDNVEDADKHEEQMRFERFLKHLVERHPAYRKYVDLSFRRNFTTPLSPLDWLGQHHMRGHVALQKKARVCPNKSNTYWIWEPMAADIVAALEKLLPAITKYMRVLGQFFLRLAVQSSSTKDKPKDYRMSSTAFISLMKQVRVFPQLFHRRELENAVRHSCCSSPETEELNFPEFIEALVRCSGKLRWGELDGGKTASDDTVVVIKFVMLIFAMEGQGSVLKKRNEDVSAILGFLGQQQKKKQAEKLFRFRKMLVDNKRRIRTSRNHQLPSVWNQVRLQFSPMNSPTRSPTRSNNTFDELTESWDGDSPRRVSTEPFVFDAQTIQTFDIDLPPSPKDVAIDPQTDGHLQPSSMVVKNEHDQNYFSNTSADKTPRETPHPLPEKTTSTSCHVACHNLAVSESQKEESNVPKDLNTTQEQTECLIPKQNLERVDGDLNYAQEPLIQPTSLVEPMEKDEFLREIMDSIGDVELILNQRRFTGSNRSMHGKRQPQRILSNKSVHAACHALNADSMEHVPSLSDLAGDSLLHDQHNVTFRNSVDEVHIRDPMLNYLTDVERFTESTDTASLVSIADMTGLPFSKDTASQPDPDTCASQEIRPSEQVK